jgi:hypothetical protein
LLDEPPPGGTFMSLNIGDEVFHGREIRLRFDTAGRAIELRDDASYPNGTGVTKFHLIGASLDSTGAVIFANEVNAEGGPGPSFRIVNRSTLAKSRFSEVVAAAAELRRRCG